MAALIDRSLPTSVFGTNAKCRDRIELRLSLEAKRKTSTREMGISQFDPELTSARGTFGSSRRHLSRR
jgi:hypothetical protein